MTLTSWKNSAENIRQEGELTLVLWGMGSLPPQERSALGHQRNSHRLEKGISKKTVELKEAALKTSGRGNH